MSGVYPNLDAGDLETRVRTYLNEVSADFFTQADIWRWLSVGAKDIAQSSTCIRRVLDAVTASSTRTVTTNCYKVMHVEYIPSSGRPIMLTKIDPLRLGHYPIDGATPQYWYEYGVGSSQTIGIEPLPASAYELRLYVVDLPKMTHLTFASFTEGVGATNWTESGTGWTLGTTAVHAGAVADTLTYNTALGTANTNFTVVFKVSGVGTGGTITPSIGGTNGIAVTTNGWHAQTIAGTTPWTMIFTATNSITIDDLTIYKEADFAATTDQTELPTAWQHLLALYATHSGLIKEKKLGAAQMLANIYFNEIAYLRQNIVEVIPDGKSDLIYT